MLISQSSLRADQLSSNDQRIAGIRSCARTSPKSPSPSTAAPVRYLIYSIPNKMSQIKVALHNFTRSSRVTQDRRELSVTRYDVWYRMCDVWCVMCTVAACALAVLRALSAKQLRGNNIPSDCANYSIVRSAYIVRAILHPRMNVKRMW